MKKKIIGIAIAGIVASTALAGCGTKEPVTMNEFIMILEQASEDFGMDVYGHGVNNTAPGEDAITAYYDDPDDKAEFGIDFSVWETEDLAKLSFEAEMEEDKEMDGFSKKGSDSYSYKITLGEANWTALAERVGNTTIYIMYSEDNKENVDTLLQKLGY